MTLPIPNRVDAGRIKFVIKDIEYEWYGGLGAVIKSYENGISQGDTRVIGGMVFYAYSVRGNGWFRSKEVCWVPVGEIDIDWIRSFKSRLFA